MYRQRDGGEREYEGSWLTNQDCLTCRPLETTFLTLAIAWDALKGIVWACWSGFVSGTYPYSEYHSHCRVWRSTGAKQCGRRTGVTQREALFDWKPRCLKQCFVTCTVTYKHHKANEILYIHQAQKHARNIKVKLFLFSCLKLLHTWKAVSGGVWTFCLHIRVVPWCEKPTVQMVSGPSQTRCCGLIEVWQKGSKIELTLFRSFRIPIKPFHLI